MKRSIFATLLCSLAAVALPLPAMPLPCGDLPVSADAPTDDLARTACRAVADAVEALGRCGLALFEPVHVAVVDRPEHPVHGVCLGYYDSRTQCVAVAAPERAAAILMGKDARRHLPADALFRGLVAHELAHAVVAQSLAARSRDEDDFAPELHEFIAAVFEMAAYGADARAVLLAVDPVRPAGSRDMVNMGIYALAPRVFANNAWAIYQSAPDGCGLIRGILSGDLSPSFK